MKVPTLMLIVSAVCAAIPAFVPPKAMKEFVVTELVSESPAAQPPVFTEGAVDDGIPDPIITITVPATDPYDTEDSSETVSGTTQNDVSTVTYRIDGGGENACSTGVGTFSCSITLSIVGLNQIVVTATGAGGVSTDETYIDYEPPPTISITSPNTDPVAVSGSPQVVSGTISVNTAADVTWSTSPGGGSGTCTFDATTFSCSITTTDGAQETVTITGEGVHSNGTDTIVLNFPTFDLTFGGTSPNDLSDSLTVAGTPMDLVFSCYATDISGTNMNCRDASTGIVFAEFGSGSSPTVTAFDHPWSALDTAERIVKIQNSGKFYANSNENLWANGDDVVIEVLIRQGATTNAAVLGNATGVGTKGVLLTTTTTQATLRVGDGTTNLSQASGNAGNTNAWAHIMGWIDDSANFGVCLNGTCSSNTSIGTVGDWSAGGTDFALGTSSDGSASYGGTPALFFRAWKKAGGGALSGASNSTDIQTIQLDRMATIFGVRAPLAAGTVAPTTIARASAASVDQIDSTHGLRSLYRLGYRAPRIQKSNGHNVYRSEPQSTNLITKSTDLTTTWTAITVGDATDDDSLTGVERIGTTAGDSVEGNNSDAEHGFSQSVTLTAATHTFSVFAATGTESFAVLRTGIANTTTFFDLDACAVCNVGSECSSAIGTTGSAVLATRALRYPIDTNDDGTSDVEWCRISITYTGTAASHAHDLLCASADNDLTYNDADTSADCYFYGAQVEAKPIATTFIFTNASTVSRVADDLRYSGTSHYTGSPATLDVEATCPNSLNVETDSTFASVGTGSANFGAVGIAATDDRPRSNGTVTSTQWNIAASSGDVTDGSEHNHRVVMITNDVEAFFNTTSTGTDVSATMPTSASSFLYLGSNGSTAANTMCNIYRVRLWSVEATPTVAP
jgi:hypothetical protein